MLNSPEAASNIVAGCGGELTKRYGRFQTPNYPAAYSPNVDCIWHIKVEPGYAVQLNIKNYDVETNSACEYDSLEVCICSIILFFAFGH